MEYKQNDTGESLPYTHISQGFLHHRVWRRIVHKARREQEENREGLRAVAPHTVLINSPLTKTQPYYWPLGCYVTQVATETSEWNRMYEWGEDMEETQWQTFKASINHRGKQVLNTTRYAFLSGFYACWYCVYAKQPQRLCDCAPRPRRCATAVTRESWI